MGEKYIKITTEALNSSTPPLCESTKFRLNVSGMKGSMNFQKQNLVRVATN